MKQSTEILKPADVIEAEYKDFILNREHPCIMAKALFKMDKYDLKCYDNITETGNIKLLLSDIANYLDQYNFDDASFESFIAVFPNDHFEDEISFEKFLWQTLQSLHESDTVAWDKKVSDDPENPKFSFSLAGKAFYVVGLHPNSSRIARKAPYTTLVFNLHSQFDQLREMGTYHSVRDTIRKNDEKLQGEFNPMLRDFGNDSETKQYSGRKVDESWKCPFHHKAV